MLRLQLNAFRSTFVAWIMIVAILTFAGAAREASAAAAKSPIQAVTQSQSYRELWDSMSQMAALDQRLLNWSDLVEEPQADGKVAIRLSFIAVRHFRPGHSAPPMWRSSQLGSEVGWFDAIRSYGEVRALVMFDESQAGWVLVDFHYRPSLR